MAKNIKKRNWAFVLYPESAPADWREQLQLSGLMGAISPLHDRDVNPDGEPKKAHYHVILVYGAPTTYNNVLSLTESLNQPIPQSLEQVRGYYRYLTHKDNPEKFQYDERDITTFNGFDIRDFVEVTKSEVAAIKVKLHRLIDELDLIEYSDLMDYLLVNDMMVEHDIASSHTLFFNALLRSRRHRHERGSNLPKADPETGEVLDEQ